MGTNLEITKQKLDAVELSPKTPDQNALNTRTMIQYNKPRTQSSENST